MDERSRIISHSRLVFTKEGFYKITMDELAAGMHISKKTIYKHFRSKDELVNICFLEFISVTAAEVLSIGSEESHPIERFLRIILYLARKIGTISKPLLYDMRVHAPELWQQLEKTRTGVLQQVLFSVITESKYLGLVNGYNDEVMAAIFLSAVQGVINPVFLSSVDISNSKALRTVTEIFMNGILTPEGKEEFNKICDGDKIWEESAYTVS